MQVPPPSSSTVPVAQFSSDAEPGESDVKRQRIQFQFSNDETHREKVKVKVLRDANRYPHRGLQFRPWHSPRHFPLPSHRSGEKNGSQHPRAQCRGTKAVPRGIQIELDSGVKHSVYSLTGRSGVPTDRTMTMRWAITWKIIPGAADKKAKTRFVVRGFQDPDLIELRTEAPALARHSRRLLVQVAASSQWKLPNGDVKTAF